MVGFNINGPDPKWKVYSRNRWCKKEAGPKETNEPKEIIGPQNDQQQQNNSQGKEPTSSKTNHKTSPKMLEGSGVKEIIRWEERHNDDYKTGVLKSATSSTKCELVKEAASNWDMAKYLGVKCCNQEDIMVCKMVSMEERDKEEAQRNNEYYNIQYKGAGEGVVGLNQKTSEKRKNRYVMSTRD